MQSKVFDGTRMKLLFSNYLGDYSYSFQGSSELISIAATVSWLFWQNAVPGNYSPRHSFDGYSYMLQWLSNLNVVISKRMVYHQTSYNAYLINILFSQTL